MQRLLEERIIRQVTPIYDTRALGYWLDARRRQGRPGAPVAGGARSINSHPGVSHNYLRNHEFNMWFTIAVEPDSRARPRRHAGRARSELTGAESIRQLPTLKLFKIRMDLEMEGDTEALASAGAPSSPSSSTRQPTTSSTSR